MASEPTEEDTLEITVPGELGSWLDERAADLGVDRATVLEQLVASYRATAELDGAVDGPGVDDRLADLVDERVAAALDGRGDPSEAVRADLEQRLAALEVDVDEKIDDVRERVIQVKRETDDKAPAEHTHRELERVDGLAARIDDLEATVADLADALETEREDRTAAVEDLDDRLAETEERLETVAWVVSDLREAVEARGGVEAVDRIKRAAAQADVERARCESCGRGVDVALLTEPNCPHCEATVTDVEPANGFFGKPTLLVASQLESGE